VYNEQLATAILKALNSAYPDKVGLDELTSALPDFTSLREEEWLGAIAVLEGEGKVSGKFLRTGMAGTLQGAALMQITTLGRQSVTTLDPAPSAARLDPHLKIPDAGEFEHAFLAQSQNAKAENPLSLIIVDVDHFKAVNDTYGHLVGTEVLKQVAETVAGVCKNKGTVYRYGGDELAILLPNYSLEEAKVLAERLRTQIVNVRTRPPKITPSIGVATFPDPIEKLSDLFKAADDALYVAKTNGRNQVRTAGKAKTAQRTIPLTRQSLSVYMRSDEQVRRLDEAIASHSGQPFTPAEDASIPVLEKAKQLGVSTINQLQDLVRTHGDLSLKLSRCIIPITPILSGQSLHYVLDITAAQRGVETLRKYFESLRHSTTAAEYADEVIETLNLLQS
jgi:diguanylate cyclase (GGDEF)-like protein